MQRIELHPEDYLPAAPSQEIVQRYGIAIVGCGNIARNTHLPAYSKFGYRIVAACDVIEEESANGRRRIRYPVLDGQY